MRTYTSWASFRTGAEPIELLAAGPAQGGQGRFYLSLDCQTLLGSLTDREPRRKYCRYPTPRSRTNAGKQARQLDMSILCSSHHHASPTRSHATVDWWSGMCASAAALIAPLMPVVLGEELPCVVWVHVLVQGGVSKMMPPRCPLRP